MSVHLIVILVSFWVGSIIFFSAIIAPTIFKSVDEKNAGYFLRAFFPKYYYFGVIMGLFSVLILILNNLISALNYQLILMLVSMIILSIISLKLIPLINNPFLMNGDIIKVKYLNNNTEFNLDIVK